MNIGMPTGLLALSRMYRQWKSGSGTGCFREMHGGWCPSSSSSCLPPRTNYINGIWASLETTLCQLCSIATLRSCDVLILSTAKGSHWSPLQGLNFLEAVWKRLSDRFASVVADTSMITLSTAYTAHFHDIHIDGKENAKTTGDCIKILMLTLPFMVRDHKAPEVHSSLHILVYTLHI